MFWKLVAVAIFVSLGLAVANDADARRRGLRSSSGSSYRCKVCGKQHFRDGFITNKTWLKFCHKCDKFDCKQHQNATDAAWLPKNKKRWQNLEADPAPVAVPDAPPVVRSPRVTQNREAAPRMTQRSRLFPRMGRRFR